MRGPQLEARTQAGRFGAAHVHVLALPAESILLDDEKPRILFGFPLRKLVFDSYSSAEFMPAALWFGLRHQGPFGVSSRIDPPGSPGFGSDLHCESSFLTAIQHYHQHSLCLRRYGLACGARVHLLLA